MILVIRLAAFLLVTSMSLAGCRETTMTAVEASAPLTTRVPQIAHDVLAARGEIVEQSTLTELHDPDLVVGEAVRAVYRSASGVDGRAREVSGVFLIPRGTAPPQGWPVVSMAHGTTGIGSGCGPSLGYNLMGSLPGILAYIADGYAVAMSDYEGLGTPGRHPYLEPRTAAFNITDAVRALRNIFPGVSTRWAAFGESQGGQAVWAADESARWYGQGLDLVGAVALSPAANITPLADLADTGSLTAEQQALLPLVIAGLQHFNPDLAESSPLNGMGARQLDEMVSCQAGGDALQDDLLPQDFNTFDDDGFTTRFRDALRRVALPQEALSAPMLVINGLRDQIIFPQWVRAAVDDSCRRLGTIEHIEVFGAGHGDLGEDAYGAAEAWVHDRFDGLPAQSDCGRPPRTLS